jgi:hypothetical protein
MTFWETAEENPSLTEYELELESAGTLRDVREIESVAGRHYWQTWARLPVNFDGSWRGMVPDHWRTAGPRYSVRNKTRGRPDKAPRRRASCVGGM